MSGVTRVSPGGAGGVAIAMQAATSFMSTRVIAPKDPVGTMSNGEVGAIQIHTSTRSGMFRNSVLNLGKLDYGNNFDRNHQLANSYMLPLCVRHILPEMSRYNVLLDFGL